MRVASWAVVVCAALSALGVFLPSIELQVGGIAVNKRTSLSLYQLNARRDQVKRLIAMYHHSDGAKLGGKLVKVAIPKLRGRAKDLLGDANDAMETLDEVDDADVATAARALKITLWSFLLLNILAAVVMFGEAMRDRARRNRLLVATGLAFVITAIAVVLHLVLREVAWQANDEVGRSVVGLGVGAYMMPIAAIGGFVAIVVLLVQRRRDTARSG